MMSLFTTSYLPSSSLPVTGLSSLEGSLGTSSQTEGEDHRKHQNFIRVLQCAVSLDTRILPLTWEPGFEKLGQDGATGSVNQNLLNSDLTFAFKRFKPDVTDPRLSEAQFRDQQFDAIITELTVLSSQTVRDHPCISPFLGLCFELSPVTDEEVWPVLVFSKSNEGDLASFISKNKQLDSELLLGMCGEVARGINILHSVGVVHADIKPGNILVAQDIEQDAMSITLADFGFARFAPNDDGPVKVTRSEPWEAPEWSHREFKLNDAKKLDMYSFGLLCLWLFFKDESLSLWDLPLATVNTAFAENDSSAFKQFQSKKHSEDSILLLAKELVKVHDFGDSEVGSRLNRVFDLTLAHRPEKRASSMKDLIEIACDEPHQSELDSPGSVTRVDLPQWHGSLQIENLFFHLESCDYRVHFFIMKALAQMAEGKGCDICSQNAAYQLAICRAIGFGTDSSHGETDELLPKQNETMKVAVIAALQRIKESNQKSALLANLAKLGWRYDLPTRYSREGIIVNAIEYYRRASFIRSRLFGPANFSTLRLQGILVNLLRWNDQSQEAIEIALAMSDVSVELAQSDQTEIKTELARLFADLGNTEQAAKLEKEIIEAYANGQESTHTERLDNQQNFADLLVKQGDYDAAIEIAEQNLRECLQELGPLHSSTRGARRCLAAAYGASGQLERSIESGEALVEAGEKFLIVTKPNPKLVEDISRLGLQYYQLGNQDSSKNCYEKVLALIKISPDMATPAVNAANNYAVNLIKQGNLDLPVTILKALIPESTKFLGHKNRQTAMVLGNLAYAYTQQKCWDWAEPLERQVIEIRREVLGESHHDTITAMGNLRGTLLAQNRCGEAVTIGREELSIIKSRPKFSLVEMIDATQTVARAFESADAFTQALPFIEEEIILKLQSKGDPPAGVLTAMARAAICNIRIGVPARARELIVDLLLRMQHGSQENIEEFLSELICLSKLCLDKGYISEAEQVLVGALLLSQQSPALPKDLEDKVEVLKSQYFQHKGIESAGIVFNPSGLLNQPLGGVSMASQDEEAANV